MNATKPAPLAVTVFSLKPGSLLKLAKATWRPEDWQGNTTSVFNLGRFLFEIEDTVQSSSKGKKVCIFYLQDACRFGGKCRSAHPMELKSIDKVCQLCGLEVRHNGNYFGLLVNCAHSFCAGCVKGWNKVHNTVGKAARCPVCTARSPTIITSVLWLEDRLTKQEVSDDLSHQKPSAKPSHPISS